MVAKMGEDTYTLTVALILKSLIEALDPIGTQLCMELLNFLFSWEHVVLLLLLAALLIHAV
jgi:hypothetical protein